MRHEKLFVRLAAVVVKHLRARRDAERPRAEAHEAARVWRSTRQLGDAPPRPLLLLFLLCLRRSTTRVGVRGARRAPWGETAGRRGGAPLDCYAVAMVQEVEEGEKDAALRCLRRSAGAEGDLFTEQRRRKAPRKIHRTRPAESLDCAAAEERRVRALQQRKPARSVSVQAFSRFARRNAEVRAVEQRSVGGAPRRCVR